MQLFEGPRQPGVRLAFAASPRASQVRQLCKMILNFVASDVNTNDKCQEKLFVCIK